ncbi:MAG: protein kinase family protein [Chlamydiales bacterium]|nr:protein kinase family protein [Chlamydiales bacterium]
MDVVARRGPIAVVDQLTPTPFSCCDVVSVTLATIVFPVGLIWLGVSTYHQNDFQYRVVQAIKKSVEGTSLHDDEMSDATVSQIATVSNLLLASAAHDAFIPRGTRVRCDSSWCCARPWTVQSPCDILKADGKVYVVPNIILDSGVTKSVYPVVQVFTSGCSQLVAHVPNIEAPERRRELTEMIEKEGRTLLRYQDHGVDPYCGAYTAGDRAFFFQNRCDGNLMTIVNRLSMAEKFSLPEIVLSSLINVCATLEQIFSNDEVHADIKPENISIKRTASGWVGRLADFGGCIKILEAKEKTSRVKIDLEERYGIAAILEDLKTNEWFLSLLLELSDIQSEAESWYPATVSYKNKLLQQSLITEARFLAIQAAVNEGGDAISLCANSQEKFLAFLLAFDKKTIRGTVDHISPLYYIRRYPGKDSDIYALVVSAREAFKIMQDNALSFFGSNTNRFFQVIIDELIATEDLTRARSDLERILTCHKRMEDIPIESFRV